jgi:hypothetical protein
VSGRAGGSVGSGGDGKEGTGAYLSFRIWLGQNKGSLNNHWGDRIG